MQRLTSLFNQGKKGLLNVYFTAGYPALNDTVPIIKALDRAGVDMIEIGMPYSDPLADGPTIQQSSQIALRNGMTLPLLFDQIAEARKHTELPLILMGYFNQVMQYGEERFLEKSKASGIDALILPDLPLYEYEERFKPLFEAYDLGISFLITPQTDETRIRTIDRLTRGFVYMVSTAAITGAREGISSEQITYFERIAAMNLQNPRLIGFGISNSATFDTACKYAQGAIIGSAFIKSLEASQQPVEQAVANFIKSILPQTDKVVTGS